MTEIVIAKVHSEDYENLYSALSKERKEKADKFKAQDAKNLSVAAGALLNPDWEIEYSDNGKPFYKDHPEVKFNLSHSGQRVVLITSDKEVGCDVEKIKPESEIEKSLKIAERYFTSDEIEFINKSSEKQKAFCSIWTRKESYLKALGTGLAKSLNTFSVIEGVKGYIIKNIEVEPEYMYAYCIESEEDEEIQIHRRA